MNPDIRGPTPDELERFDKAFFALVSTPGFRGLSVKMALKFPAVGCEIVNFGGMISSPEAIPVMEDLASKIGRSGKAAIHHVMRAHATLNRQLKELKVKQTSDQEAKVRQQLTEWVESDDVTPEQRTFITEQLAKLKVST
jgi:hypothetical protein